MSMDPLQELWDPTTCPYGSDFIEVCIRTKKYCAMFYQMLYYGGILPKKYCL